MRLCVLGINSKRLIYILISRKNKSIFYFLSIKFKKNKKNRTQLCYIFIILYLKNTPRSGVNSDLLISYSFLDMSLISGYVYLWHIYNYTYKWHILWNKWARLEYRRVLEDGQCDFQLVELGAANSTFFSCSVGHNFLQIDLFTNIKAFMDSIDM